MEKISIDQAWEAYSIEVLKASDVFAGSAQYNRIRRAFYCGAMVYFEFTQLICQEPDPEVGLESINGIAVELDSFATGMQEGRW